MFSNDDYYNLDDAKNTLDNKKMMLEVYIKLEVITQLLIKHDITNELEIEACENYIKTTPVIKAVITELNNLESQIRNYKVNPEQHLKDLFKAKMNGQIK